MLSLLVWLIIQEALGNLLRWVMGNRKDILTLHGVIAAAFFMGWKIYKLARFWLEGNG